MSSPMKSGCVTLLAPTRRLNRALVSRVFGGISLYRQRLAYESLAMNPVSSLPPLPRRKESWYPLSWSFNPLIMWPVFPAWPVSILKLSRDPPTKTLPSLTKFQKLEALSQEPGTKTPQIIYYTVAGIPKFTEDNLMVQNGISTKSVQTQKAAHTLDVFRDFSMDALDGITVSNPLWSH